MNFIEKIWLVIYYDEIFIRFSKNWFFVIFQSKMVLMRIINTVDRVAFGTIHCNPHLNLINKVEILLFFFFDKIFRPKKKNLRYLHLFVHIFSCFDGDENTDERFHWLHFRMTADAFLNFPKRQLIVVQWRITSQLLVSLSNQTYLNGIRMRHRFVLNRADLRWFHFIIKISLSLHFAYELNHIFYRFLFSSNDKLKIGLNIRFSCI